MPLSTAAVSTACKHKRSVDYHYWSEFLRGGFAKCRRKNPAGALIVRVQPWGIKDWGGGPSRANCLTVLHMKGKLGHNLQLLCDLLDWWFVSTQSVWQSCRSGSLGQTAFWGPLASPWTPCCLH
jgi:hypothetical protein